MLSSRPAFLLPVLMVPLSCGPPGGSSGADNGLGASSGGDLVPGGPSHPGGGLDSADTAAPADTGSDTDTADTGGWELPDSNLLRNPGFENGDDGWSTAGDAEFFVQEGYATGGAHSGGIHLDSGDQAAWFQTLSVRAGVVYDFGAQVSFQHVEGDCQLRVDFLDGDGAVIQDVQLPAHRGTREFGYDYYPGIKLRAPDGAAAAEVKLFISGTGKVWFDDVEFGPASVGAFTGQVTDAVTGEPLAGARVSVRGEVWGRSYAATTDAGGRYLVEGIPISLPRYILVAESDGYRDRSQGQLDPGLPDATAVDFSLTPGTPIDASVQVRFGHIVAKDESTPPQIPEAPVIPDDPEDYPGFARVHLQAGEWIDPQAKEVASVAEEIVASMSEQERADPYQVAQAVYLWVVKHVEHDTYYLDAGGDNTIGAEPFVDPTTGIWLTNGDDAMAWGQNFYDWLQRPEDLILHRCGLCIELNWLATALLRNLGVPARALRGSLEYWLQDTEGNGIWLEMSVSLGRDPYRTDGSLGDGSSLFRLSSFPVTPDPLVQQDWDFDTGGLWREVHPCFVYYDPNEAGFDDARSELASFEETGEVPTCHHEEPATAYVATYKDITLDLGDLDGQRIIDVRFPLGSASAFRTPTDEMAWWCDCEACVTDTWIETESDPSGEEELQWFHVELDVTSLVE